MVSVVVTPCTGGTNELVVVAGTLNVVNVGIIELMATASSIKLDTEAEMLTTMTPRVVLTGTVGACVLVEDIA